MNGQAGKRLHHPGCKIADGWIRQFPCRNGQRASDAFSQAVVIVAVHGLLKGLAELIDEHSHHAYAVFQLDIPVIPFLCRKIPASRDIPFIAGMNKMEAVSVVILLLMAFDQVNDFTGLLLRIQFDREQSLSVLGDSGRNDADTP